MAFLIKALTPKELIKRGAPKLFTTSAQEWKTKLVSWFETSEDGPKRKLYPAQYEMLLINMLAYGFSLLGKEAQMAAEQRWLLFAKGKHLDILAANNSTYRLKASKATCRVRFQLKAEFSRDVLLSAGQIIKAGDIVFVTDEQVTLPAGMLSVEVGVTAEQAGPAANGLLAGQIKDWSSSDAPELSVVNITQSQGGAAEEDDDSLRVRAANAHDRISKAGGRESYRQQVRAFSPSIMDVEVIRPQEGHIWIYALLDSGLPSDDFKSRLGAFMAPENKRPQGDNVSFPNPQAVTFSISGTAKVTGDLNAAKAKLEKDLVDAAKIWSRSLGDYLALSALSCVARTNDFLIDIDLSVTGLANRQLQPHQFAVCTGVSITPEKANV